MIEPFFISGEEHPVDNMPFLRPNLSVEYGTVLLPASQ